MDMQNVFGQIEREIALVDAQIAERQAKIDELEQQNKVANERKQKLAEARAAIDAAVTKLQDAGPFLGEPMVPPAVVPAARKKRGPKLKKIVLPMLDEAGSSGMTLDEIIAVAKGTHGIDLDGRSVNGFLYKLKADGGVERAENKRWRNIASGTDAGEVQQSAAAD